MIENRTEGAFYGGGMPDVSPTEALPEETIEQRMPVDSSVPSTPEQRRKNLLREFNEIENKNRKLNTKGLINRNQVEDLKKGIMQKLFKVMRDSGVDPSDLSSINRFLQLLEEQDPDLRQMFEFAFDALSGEETEEIPQEEPGEENAGMMGQDLAQNMMMGR